MDDYELVAEIRRTASALASLTHRLLDLIGTANQAKIWVGDGAATPAAWLVAQLAVSHQTAGAWAEVADRMDELPATSEAMASGKLSFDQVRALSRFATAEHDERLSIEAESLSVSQLRSKGRRSERIDPDDQRRAHRDRSVRWWWDEADRSLHFKGQMPDQDGTVFVKAVSRFALHTPPEPESGLFEPFETRCADALIQMASQSLGQDGGADRSCVVVHVDADRLASDAGVGQVDDGPSVSMETVRRWACDGRLQIVAEDDGIATGVGRATRRIPGWLGRQLRQRDGGCRFPGCERTRWVHSHHLVHWARGGATDIENLATLCGFHHRLVHEHGWRIAGDPNKSLTWVRPNGTPYIHKADPLPSAARALIVERMIENSYSIRGPAKNDTS